MKLAFAVLAFFFAQAHALPFEQIKIGTPVELTMDFDANKVMSWAMLQCRIGQHAVWPKVKIGPGAGPEGVSARYFTVAWKSVDPFTYSIDLISDQMPCGCVLRLDQTPQYLRGAGSEFQTLIAPDLNAMRAVPPIPTACSNLPEWVTGPSANPGATVQGWGKINGI